GAAGIDEAIREEVRPDEGEGRRAALVMARKRGFGPFGREPVDRERRQKQIAAMLRAGHPLDSAREMVDAASQDAAERWAAELDADESLFDAVTPPAPVARQVRLLAAGGRTGADAHERASRGASDLGPRGHPAHRHVAGQDAHVPRRSGAYAAGTGARADVPHRDGC